MDVRARGNVLGRFVPARYIVTILGSIGLAIVYGMKVNLSMAMVGMLNHTALRSNNSEEENFTTAAIRESDRDDGPFMWTSNVQGVILSGYYWGYVCSQIPAGRVAELTSAKWVLFSSVAITAVCTMLSPVMAEAHYMALTSMRILEGIGGGFSYPALSVLLSKWSPPAERSFMAALVYSGATLGTVISMLTTGILTAKAGWPSSFYVTGGLSSIWCLLWVVLVQDSPQKQSFISVKERNMIIVSQGGNVAHQLGNKKPPVPWRAAFTSPAFLGLLVAHFGCNWGWFMLITEVPFYMKQVFHFNLYENTLYVAPPYFGLWIFAAILSKTLDWLRGRGTITTTTARKIATLCSSGTASLCLIALCFIGNNPIAAVIIMAIAVTSLGGHNCGVIANHIDIAPNFAVNKYMEGKGHWLLLIRHLNSIKTIWWGSLISISIVYSIGTLFAVTNSVAAIPGVVVPLFAGAVTRNNQTIEAWRIVFLATVGIYATEIIAFITFGSGEVQPWNKVNADKDEVEKMPLNDNKNKKDIET